MGSISDILTAYYQTPAHLSRLRRALASIEDRIARLISEHGEIDTSLLDFTIPGTVASYEPNRAQSGMMSNPTESSALRLGGKVCREMQGLRERQYDTEQAIHALEYNAMILDAPIKALAPGDADLLRRRYKDQQEYKEISQYVFGISNRHQAQRRIAQIERELFCAVAPCSLFNVPESCA